MRGFVNRLLLSALVLALIFGLGAFLSCGGKDENDDTDDDFDWDDFNDDDEGGGERDPEEPGDPCEDNHPPVLSGVHYIVGDQELIPPVVVERSDTTDFGIYFEYYDLDCNLPGGHFYLNFNDEGWLDMGELPDDIGCKGKNDSSPLYGFGFSEPLDPSGYHGLTFWTDDCGALSNIMEFEFTVVGDQGGELVDWS